MESNEMETAAEAVPAIPANVPVTVTEKAVRMVRATIKEEGLDETSGLRIAVRGGGCSGFEYALDFETEQRETDLIYTQNDLTIFVDAISARFLKGTEIDYVMGMQGAGFKFNNPNAVGQCGCGSSFSV